MQNKILAAAFGVALLSGCQQATAPAPAPSSSVAAVTEDEARKAFDSTVASWQSMDAAKIKGVYAPDVAGFDFAMAPLVTDRATWDKAQDAFAAGKIDSLKVSAKKIQLLGADAFVVSSMADATSSTMPKNNGVLRCTDVYQREAGGAWLVVNEHCSSAPKGAAA